MDIPPMMIHSPNCEQSGPRVDTCPTHRPQERSAASLGSSSPMLSLVNVFDRHSPVHG